MQTRAFQQIGLLTALGVIYATGCQFNESGLRAPLPDGGSPPDSDVTPHCGDGQLDPGETCDGSALGGADCASLQLGTGTVTCRSDCTLDTSGCTVPPTCGDGEIQDPELCDTTDFGGRDCASVTGHAEGTLACAADCTLITTGCHTCGDGVVEGDEQCDDLALDGADCVSRGHEWGTLACTSGCTYDESGCFDYPENWLDLDCPYRKRIEIHPSQVDAALTLFPVVVKVIDADLAAHAQANGGDLAFAPESGTVQLPHEIERFNGTTGSLVAWVRLPQLSPTVPTVFYLYYGHPDCGGSVSSTDVWDSSYTGVWHLREAGVMDNRLDSTVHGNDGVPGGFDGDEPEAARNDGGDRYDGFDDHLILPAPALAGLTAFTVCYWIRTTENGHDSTSWKNPTMFGQITTGYQSDDFGILSDSGLIAIRSGLCDSNDELVVSAVAINDDAWHHICAVNDGSTVELYVDNLIVAQVCSDAHPVANQAFWLGGQSGESTGEAGAYHEGLYDELRISDVARSDAWRAASYRNQATPNLFLFIDPEETLP